MIPRSKANYEETLVDTVPFCVDNSTSEVFEFPSTQKSGYKRETMLGYDIPEFHKRKRVGELLPQTPFSQCFESMAGVTVSHVSSPDSGGSTCTTPNFGRSDAADFKAFPASDSGVDNVDLDRFVQGAAAAIYSRGHDSLTFLAELNKVVSMFMNVGKSLVNLLQKGDIASTWLQYRYGWRTLYYDLVQINDAIEQLSDTRTRFSERQGMSFTNQVMMPDAVDFSVTGAGSVFATISDSYTVSVRGIVAADILPPAFSFNPVVTAWELLKYSFIIDWVINVGQWLAGMSFLFFSTNHSAAKGYRIVCTRSLSTGLVEPISGYSISGSVSGTGTYDLSKRIPTTVSTIPHFGVNLDVSKVLDLIAIIWRNAK